MKLTRMLQSWPRSFLFRTPFTCNLKVTTRCNLKCGFCGLWTRPVTTELHLNDYHHIAKLLHATGIGRVVITGGEPLLRDDAPDITALFARRGISTTLLTNGTLLTPEKLNAFVKSGLNDIGISLDSLDPSRLDRICQSEHIWEKVVEAIRLSVDTVREGVVQVMTTVTRENLHEIPDIVRFIHEDLGAWSIVNPINVPPSKDSVLSADRPDWAPPFPEHDVDSVYDKLVKMKRSGVRLLVSNAFLEDSRAYLKDGQFKWHCDAGERYFTIFPDGGLAPCSDQPSLRRIMEMSARDFRDACYLKEVRDVQRHCGGCIFSCWREASYLFNNVSVMKERVLSLRRIFKGR